MLSYRHHITAFLQALLTLYLLSSCVSDRFWENLEASRDGDKTLYYLSLKIMDTSGGVVGGTRATDNEWDKFEDGSEKEHAVGEEGNYIVMLDANEKLYGVYPLRLYEWEGQKEETEEAIYFARFYHDKDKGLPTSCLVVLNANDAISGQLTALQEGCKLTEIFDIEWDGTGSNDPKAIGFRGGNGDDPGYFTMTTAVYVETDAEGNKKVINTQKIPENSIVKSLAEARDRHVTAYVERMVAKFEIEIDEEDSNDGYYIPKYNGDPDQIEVFSRYYDKTDIEHDQYINGNPEYLPMSYKIRLTGWGINALETKSRLFKNIPQESLNLQNFHTYSNYHHSCWSEDSHYTDYCPWQYLYAVDASDKYYEDRDNDAKSPLQNYPFTNFAKRGFNDIIYVPENTYGGKALTDDYDNRTNLLAGTHLILCAQLGIGEEEATTAYRDRIGYFYYTERECFAELVRRFNNALASQDTMRYNFYRWPDQNETHKKDKNNGIRYVAKTSGGYQLYYNGSPLTHTDIIDRKYGALDTYFIEATIKNGDGKLIPWIEGLTIKNSAGGELKVRVATSKDEDASYSKTVDSDDIKSMLYEWVGPVDYFNGGNMYYAAPIKHYAVTYNNEEGDQHKLGDFGVVRNHWYKFTLKGINSLGVPIAKSTNAIVPNSASDNRQLNLKVEILDWHEIETTVPIL